ncbi:uncharacterized protein LOC135833659 [Planococcus citri]|uniref:uncharacterized protein LOC135833659 n=1 Tax=Planococcus citri TaxID=170843 RepID=UPI0031F7F0EF
MDQAMSKLLALRAEDEMVEKALKKKRKRSKKETETEKPILVRRMPDAVPATENTVQTETVPRPAPEQQRQVERPRAPTPKPTMSDASENERSSSDSESDSEESDDDSSDSSSEEEEEENGDDSGTGGGATSNSTQNPPPPPPPSGNSKSTQSEPATETKPKKSSKKSKEKKTRSSRKNRLTENMMRSNHETRKVLTKEVRIETWHQMLQLDAEIYNINLTKRTKRKAEEKQLRNLVLHRLDEYYFARVGHITPVQKMIDAIFDLRRVERNVSRGTIKSEFNKLMLGRGETLDAFFGRMDELTYDFKMQTKGEEIPEPEIFDRIVEATESIYTELRVILKSKGEYPHTSLADLKLLLLQLESERRGGPQQANYASHRPVIRRSDGKPQPRPPYNADTLPRPPDHNCYNCSNPDHYDYECPKWEDGPRCFRCSEWGHFGTTCNNPRVFYKHEFAKYRDSSRDNRIRDTVNGAAQLISGERQPEDFMGIPRFDRDARNDIEENRRRHQSSSRYRSPNRDEQHRSRSSPPRETDKSSRSATDRDATQTENRRQSSSTHSSASGPSPPPGHGRSMARPEGARRLRNFPAMLVDPHIEEELPYTSFLLMELPDIDVNSLNGTQAGLIYNHIAKWEQMLAWFRTRVELRIHAINVEARKPTEIEPVFDIGGVEYSSFLDTVGPAIIGQPMVQPPPGFPPIPPVPKPVYLEHTKEQTMLPFTNTPQPGTSALTSKTEKPVEMNPIGCIKAPENKTEKGSSPNKPQTKAAKKEGTSTDEIFKKFREQNPNAGKSPLNLGKVYNPRRDARTPKKTDTNREGPEHRKPTKPIKLDRTIAAPKPPTPPPMPEKPLWEVKSTKAVAEAEMDTTAQSEAKTDDEWNKPGPSSAQSNATEKPHLNSLGQDMNAPRPRTPEIIRQNLLIRPDIPCEEEWEIGDGEVIDRRRANYRSVNFMYVKQIMELNFTKVNERLTEIETRLHREQVPDEADEGRPMPEAERALLTRQQEELNDAAMAITRVLEGKHVTFLGDTGATSHFINNPEYLTQSTEYVHPIQGANGDPSALLSSNKRGMILGMSEVCNSQVHLTDVLAVPRLTENLLSLRKFVDLGYEILLTNKHASIIDPVSTKVILAGEYKRPYWEFRIRTRDREIAMNTTTKEKPKKRPHSPTRPSCSSANTSKSIKRRKVQTENLPSTSTAETENTQEMNEPKEVKQRTKSKRKAKKKSKETGGDSEVRRESSPGRRERSQERREQNREIISPVYLCPESIDDIKLNREISDEELGQPINVERLSTVKKPMNYVDFKNSPAMRWHYRLGHLSYDCMMKLKKTSPALAKVKISREQIRSCEVCILANMKLKPFKEVRDKSKFIFDRIHSDVMGPLKTPTLYKRHRWIVTFVDDASRFAIAYTMQYKSDVLECFLMFLNLVEKYTRGRSRVSTLRCDNGGEYTGAAFKQLCDHRGITIEYSEPKAPQHNGTAERFNQTIMSKVRVMLLDSGVPQYHWDTALATAVQIYNRAPHSSIGYRIPIKQIFPDVTLRTEYMRRYGCIAYVHRNDPTLQKVDQRAVLGVLVGFTATGYKVLLPQSNKIIRATHVKCVEFKNYRDINGLTEKYVPEIPEREWLKEFEEIYRKPENEPRRGPLPTIVDKWLRTASREVQMWRYMLHITMML